jgi:hypothetical protein
MDLGYCKKVHIFIEVDIDAHKQSELQTFSTRQCLPQTDERGILSIGPMEELWAGYGQA